MRQIEQTAVEGGLASAALMENAGVAASEIIVKSVAKRPAVVLCGPGNNGGDGFVVARKLKEAGWDVTVGLLGEYSALADNPKMMADLYGGGIEAAAPALLGNAGLIVDALFGTGLSRGLEGAAAELVTAVNAHPAPAIAIDIPSGVDASSGAVKTVAVQAATTVTFAAKKTGHLLFPGRAYCGATTVVGIGIADQVFQSVGPKTAENAPMLWGGAFSRPRFDTHKYLRGHAAIVAGARYQTGASRLAAMGAARVGVGLVTLLANSEAAPEIAAQITSAMLRIANDATALSAVLSDARFTAVGIGPALGLDKAARAKTEAAIASTAATVLDADALTVFADNPPALFSIVRDDDILTPHEGEFERLFADIAKTDLGKLEKARLAASRAGAVILLKGADTVIASPDGRAAINTNAPPDLATAGSGDVLTGFITGLRAQGMPAFEAACAGAWLHGACGQAVGMGLIAEDLPGAAPHVLRTLFNPPKSEQPAGA